MPARDRRDRGGRTGIDAQHRSAARPAAREPADDRHAAAAGARRFHGRVSGDRARHRFQRPARRRRRRRVRRGVAHRPAFRFTAVVAAARPFPPAPRRVARVSRPARHTTHASRSRTASLPALSLPDQRQARNLAAARAAHRYAAGGTGRDGQQQRGSAPVLRAARARHRVPAHFLRARRARGRHAARGARRTRRELRADPRPVAVRPAPDAEAARIRRLHGRTPAHPSSAGAGRHAAFACALSRRNAWPCSSNRWQCSACACTRNASPVRYVSSGGIRAINPSDAAADSAYR